MKVPPQTDGSYKAQNHPNLAIEAVKVLSNDEDLDLVTKATQIS
jgi:hypothetical protein